MIGRTITGLSSLQIAEGREDTKADVDEIQGLSKDLIQEWKKMAIKSKPSGTSDEIKKVHSEAVTLKRIVSTTSASTEASLGDYYFPE